MCVLSFHWLKLPTQLIVLLPCRTSELLRRVELLPNLTHLSERGKVECTFTTVTTMALAVDLLVYLYFRFKVESRKNFSERGIQPNGRGRGKRKAEILVLRANAAEMKRQNLEEDFESPSTWHQRKSVREMKDNFLIPIQLALDCTILPANRATYLHFTELQYIL